MKSSKFPSGKIVICTRAKPSIARSIPVRITKDDRTRKDTIEARESDAILAAQMLQSAVFGSCMGRFANATLNATAISAVAIASVPT